MSKKIRNLGGVKPLVLCPKSLRRGFVYHYQRDRAYGTLCGRGLYTNRGWPYNEAFVRLHPERAERIDGVPCKKCVEILLLVIEQQRVVSLSREEREADKKKKRAAARRKATLAKRKLARELSEELRDL